MLGTSKEIIANHVATGEVQMIYWPVLDIGPNSENAAAAAYCAGEQNPSAFWQMHSWLYENYSQTYRGDRSYFLDAATTNGLDNATFATCYDSEEIRLTIRQQDDARRRQGIRSRPSFDINGQIIAGAQPYSTFEQIFAEAKNE